MPEIRILASHWLSAEGHTVISAEDGRELLELVYSRNVDVVITDVMMPEADGFEVLSAVKRWRSTIRVLTISGGAPVMPMQNCLRIAKALGADGVLPKPFNRERLLEAIDRLFDAPSTPVE